MALPMINVKLLIRVAYLIVRYVLKYPNVKNININCLVNMVELMVNVHGMVLNQFADCSYVQIIK
jgi:hypothetical protein